MLIINFFRYIFGFVKFKSFGGLTERFLNMCDSENIPLWNIQTKNGEITAFTSAEGYKRIRSVSRKNGMVTRIENKKGFRFFLTKHKARSGFAVGAVAIVLIMVTLSQFVWRIDVIGNVNVDSEEILSAFEDYNVKIGAKIDSLELKDITESVISNMPSLSWASVNKKGSVLCIEVREKREIPKMYDASNPTNVVASEDGVIISSDVLQGTEEVKVGSAVCKGDLLISGVIKLRDGGEQLLHADGFVRASVNNTFKTSTQSVKLLPLKNIKKQTEIFFFGFVIPLGSNVKSDITGSSMAFLKSGEAILPIGLIHNTGFDFDDKTNDISQDVQNTTCLFLCAEHIKKLTDTAEVKSTKITKTKTGHNISYTLLSVCEKDIAELQEIYVEKTNDIA